MKKLLVTLSIILLSSTAFAQLPLPGAHVADVHKFVAGKYQFCDTVQYDDLDPEGHAVIKTIRFVPYELSGISGYLEAGFDRKGKLTRSAWKHDYNLTQGDNGMGFLYGDPRRKMLEAISFKQDGTIAQLTTLVSDLSKLLGKPTKSTTDSKIQYTWKKSGVYHAAWLEEGALVAGWANTK